MRIVILLIVIVILLLSGACIRAQETFLLFDFESDEELDQFEWKCKTLFSLSNANNSHGEKSLKIELYPSQYPGILALIRHKNWHNYRIFAFDVFNPMGKDLEVLLRIDDMPNIKDDAERFNLNLIVHPGMNHLRIPLALIRTRSTQRPLNLSSVLQLALFMDSPKEKVVFYTDYWRLE